MDTSFLPDFVTLRYVPWFVTGSPLYGRPWSLYSVHVGLASLFVWEVILEVGDLAKRLFEKLRASASKHFPVLGMASHRQNGTGPSMELSLNITITTL